MFFKLINNFIFPINLDIIFKFFQNNLSFYFYLFSLTQITYIFSPYLSNLQFILSLQTFQVRINLKIINTDGPVGSEPIFHAWNSGLVLPMSFSINYVRLLPLPALSFQFSAKRYKDLDYRILEQFIHWTLINGIALSLQGLFSSFTTTITLFAIRKHSRVLYVWYSRLVLRPSPYEGLIPFHRNRPDACQRDWCWICNRLEKKRFGLTALSYLLVSAHSKCKGNSVILLFSRIFVELIVI